MDRQLAVALFVLGMAVIVAVDVLFFRSHLWLRLMLNVGVVIFAAFGLLFQSAAPISCMVSE